MKRDYLTKYTPLDECHYPTAFDKLMGYPKETVEELAKKAKEINRMIELCKNDSERYGIESD
jgi:hypothetical protein